MDVRKVIPGSPELFSLAEPAGTVESHVASLWHPFPWRTFGGGRGDPADPGTRVGQESRVPW